MNPRLKKAERFKQIVDVESQKLNDWIEKVRNIGVDDIQVVETVKDGYTTIYYLTFPKTLIDEFNLIKNNLESIDKEHFREPIDYLIWGHEDSYDEFDWSLKINRINNNRIDINGSGLPYKLRNLGLGKKLYHKIIKLEQFISSIDRGSYKYSDFLWLSIYKSPLFLTFTSETMILCFEKSNPPTNFIEIIEKTFLNFDKISCSDLKFIDQNKHSFNQSDTLNLKISNSNCG